jgi:hypothetical protein
MDRLFAPLAFDLPPHLEPVRFWIWLQVVALRFHVRTRHGRRVPFQVSIDVQGQVRLVRIGRRAEDLTPDPFSFTPSNAWRRALTGDCPAHPGEQRDSAPLAIAPKPRRPRRIAARALPLPDT